MAKKKKNELSDEEIATLVVRKIEQSTGYLGGSELSKERENILKYLEGELPARTSKGSSSYVSTDVWDATEGMKAQLMDVFGGAQEVISFAPQGQDDIEPARQATEYVNWNFYRLNRGYEICHDVIQDGLSARVGIVKTFWESDESHQAETFEGLDETEVEGLTAQDDITDLEATQGEDGTYSGELTRKTSSGRVTVLPVAPEEFYIDSSARDLTAFHGSRCLKTKTQIKAMGYDVKKLKDIAPDGDEDDLISDETLSRNRAIRNGSFQDKALQDVNKPYWFYESFARLSLTADGDEKLYKICMAGGVVLDVSEVKRTIFQTFVPLRTAHAFFGQNFSQKSVSTANARTMLTRSIIDHAAMTNNPRHTVLSGGLINPRELLDNRLGGYINVTRPDAVNPLQQASLNPFTYQTLDMLKMQNEERTGISSLSQGMNGEAISNQNSQGLVQDLVSLSQTRQKVIARNFARFLADVALEIYTLAMENDDAQTVIELAGSFVPVNPSTWKKRKDAVISFHLGVGASQQEAQKYVMLTSMAQQNQSIKRMMGEKGLYRATLKIAQLQGIKDIGNYIADPDTLPPPQPDPMVQAEIAEKQAKAQATQAKAAEGQAKTQATSLKTQLDAQVKARELDLKERIAQADSHRKDMDIANKIDISQREMQVVESAEPAEPAKAIASPNS